MKCEHKLIRDILLNNNNNNNKNVAKTPIKFCLTERKQLDQTVTWLFPESFLESFPESFHVTFWSNCPLFSLIETWFWGFATFNSMSLISFCSHFIDRAPLSSPFLFPEWSLEWCCRHHGNWWNANLPRYSRFYSQYSFDRLGQKVLYIKFFFYWHARGHLQIVTFSRGPLFIPRGHDLV